MLQESSGKPGLERLLDRLNNEWKMASPETRQRILKQIGQTAIDLAPEIEKGAELVGKMMLDLMSEIEKG